MKIPGPAIPRDRNLSDQMESSTVTVRAQNELTGEYEADSVITGLRTWQYRRMADSVEPHWRRKLGRYYTGNDYRSLRVTGGRTLATIDYYAATQDASTGAWSSRTRYTSLAPTPAYGWNSLNKWDASWVVSSPSAFSTFLGYFPYDVARLNSVQTQMWAKAGQVDVLSWVTAAEAAKTHQSIENALDAWGRLRRCYDRYRRQMVKNRKKPKPLRDLAYMVADGSKDLAALWMEYRYGIMPTVYEIQDYWDISRGNNAKSVRVSYGQSDPIPQKVTWDSGWASPNSWNTSRTWGSREWRCRYSAGCLVQPDFGPNFGLGRGWSTAWELTPLSWMADWFVQVGSHLSAAETSAARNVRLAWQSVVVTGSETEQYNRVPVFTTGGATNYVCNGSFPNTSQHQSWHYAHRQMVTTPPNLPPQVIKLGWKRAADLTAFLRGFISRQ